MIYRYFDLEEKLQRVDAYYSSPNRQEYRKAFCLVDDYDYRFMIFEEEHLSKAVNR
ncbi:hypothetical protein Plano_0101 [Planococcus sp. PAMC 21323]|nr:hypothetical protein Plano_0101 [Planococcus sp. PAMC 21323]